jgi:hypothetical protein
MVLAHLRRRRCLSGSEGFGIRAFSRKWNAYFPLRRRLKKWWKHGSVSWAKTCALVIHIWRVAHEEQGWSSGAIKRWIFAEIQATDAGLGTDRRWRQRLSGNSKTGGTGECDRRAADFATDAGAGTVVASVDKGFALACAGLPDRRWTTSVGAAADASIERSTKMSTRPRLTVVRRRLSVATDASDA